MFKLKIERIGNSLSIRLPDEVVAQLDLKDGDRLSLTEGSEGGYRITRRSPDSSQEMRKARNIMDRYRNTLERLAG